MYETDILEHVRKVPVFSLSDINQIIKNKIYAKKFIKRMSKKHKIIKIKKGLYTLYDDSFLVSTFIKKPSYITCVSALRYHKAITQIPNEVFCFTNKKTTSINFINKINYIKTKYFFGYSLELYEGFKIPIADKEKAIIDSLGVVPIHIIEEAFDSINREKMLLYLKKIKKSKILKRIGFLMEKNNYSIYKDLKKYINYRYIPLEPLSKKIGKKNKKWRLIINTK